MSRNSPGKASKWQIWNLSQIGSINHTEPPQPTDDTKPFRPYLILTDISPYKKVTCLPIQDLGKGAGLVEVELLFQKYTKLKKDCKILCYEIYTLYEKDFTELICTLRDDDRREVNERVKRYLRLF